MRGYPHSARGAIGTLRFYSYVVDLMQKAVNRYCSSYLPLGPTMKVKAAAFGVLALRRVTIVGAVVRHVQEAFT